MAQFSGHVTAVNAKPSQPCAASGAARFSELTPFIRLKMRTPAREYNDEIQERVQWHWWGRRPACHGGRLALGGLDATMSEGETLSNDRRDARATMLAIRPSGSFGISS